VIRGVKLKFFYDVIIRGIEGGCRLLTFDDEGEGSQNGRNIDDVIYSEI